MKKTTKRGFVMTGGGAKGLYEAGVIHAFHLCGMEFDVITGSSIGAINSVFYAEYLLRKRERLSADEIEKNPLAAVEEMDPLVRSFLHAWWKMPTFKIIDDSDEGPLGQLKNDLEEFDLSLPQITSLAWWYTTPDRGPSDFAKVFPDIVRLGNELVERFGMGKELYKLWQQKRERGYSLQEVALRAYLDRFGIQHALVPDDAAENLRTVFTQSTLPLQPEHLKDRRPAQEGKAESVVEATRTMKDYAEAGIDVRLTRTNYRTGRLETSTYYTTKQFLDWLRGHGFWWVKGVRAVALGSERIQVLGNPGAVNAALASGRFPGVFAPMGIADIYEFDKRPKDEENRLLKGLLTDWLGDKQVEDALVEANGGWEGLQKSYEFWRDSKTMPKIFPKIGDYYVDGGTIDNTPSNSAIDGIREWIKQEGLSTRDVSLDLYTVFLHPEPDPGHVELDPEPALYQVVQRTLQVRGAATLASNAVTVETINTFGKRGEKMNQMAIDLTEGLQELTSNLADDMKGVLKEDQLEALNAAVDGRLRPHLKAAAGRSLKNKETTVEDLERIEQILQKSRQSSFPLHVQPVEIYPDEMPMSTLQFTERLGYKKENAIRMMTVGCYNTLWTLRMHLEQKKANERDQMDNRALDLARTWMGVENWPEDAEELDDLRCNWKCQRKSCVFYEGHCPKGNGN
jgi:hypothetical protein